MKPKHPRSLPETEPKTLCRTPTPGKKPTRINTAKFELIRKAVLAVVPWRGEGVRFGDLPELAARRLTSGQLRALGSLNWHVTTVKLELEVRGEIRRVPGASPQTLLRG